MPVRSAIKICGLQCIQCRVSDAPRLDRLREKYWLFVDSLPRKQTSQVVEVYVVCKHSASSVRIARMCTLRHFRLYPSTESLSAGSFRSLRFVKVQNCPCAFIYGVCLVVMLNIRGTAWSACFVCCLPVRCASKYSVSCTTWHAVCTTLDALGK